MADEESEEATGTCAYCQESTTSMCKGCREAPLYDECFTEPVFYCNYDCCKADWAQHKSECEKLQARKSLGRAALLLQAIFYRIRLHASTLRFKSLRLEGSTIFLDGFQLAAESQSYAWEPLLKPIPVPPDADRNLAEAVVVYMDYIDAMMYLHGFTKELMARFASKIEECTFSVTHPKLKICPVSSNGERMDSADSFIHNLYKVTLKNGEMWAVDPTGAQYGHPDPLCPWPSFEHRRSCKVLKYSNFGEIRQRTYPFKEIVSPRSFVAEVTEKQELTEALEEKIPAWAKERSGGGDKLNVLLWGPDAIFEKAKERFLDQLEDHLRVSMAKMYAPDQIARRNKSIDWRLSQSMVNPDRRKAFT